MSDPTLVVTDVMETPSRMRKRSSWEIQRAVIFALLMREIKTRFGGHWTGVVWVIGQPLAVLFSFVALHRYVLGQLHHGIYDFGVFLMVARTPFHICVDIYGRLHNGIKANLGLFIYHQVRPMDILVARTILDLVVESISFVGLLMIMGLLGFKPVTPHDLLGYIQVWILAAALGFGLGCVLAGVSGLLPKLGVFLSMISLPLFFLSGAYPILDKVPTEVAKLLLYNPILHITEMARYYFLPGYDLMNGVTWAYPSLWALSTITLGMLICRVRHHKLIAGE